eukprot:9487667-Pyramimonas_sp.AAC.1
MGSRKEMRWRIGRNKMDRKPEMKIRPRLAGKPSSVEATSCQVTWNSWGCRRRHRRRGRRCNDPRSNSCINARAIVAGGRGVGIVAGFVAFLPQPVLAL